MSLFISCKNCSDRTPGCHDICEKYIADKEKYDKLKNKANRDMDVRQYIIHKNQETYDIVSRHKQKKYMTRRR